MFGCVVVIFKHVVSNFTELFTELNCCFQVCNEVCRAFSLCSQGRSAELLTHYKSTPCPALPEVKRDKQLSAADDDSSDSEPESIRVCLCCLFYYAGCIVWKSFFLSIRFYSGFLSTTQLYCCIQFFNSA